MSARQELDAARPVLAQMDPSRGPDKAKADLIAVWSAVEAALRSLVGGSVTGGQALIRDARARQALTFDQANALVAFLSVREQLDRPDYQPTESDVNTARSAFLKLDAGLMSGAGAAQAPPPYAPQSYGSPAPLSPYAAPRSPAPTAAPIVPPAPGLHPVMRNRRPIWVGALLVLFVAGLALMVWYIIARVSGGGGTLLTDGIQAYERGDRLTAASNFERAARANPNDAMPHVYLARMAREVGNYTVANQELQLALKAQPGNLTGRREYGSLFLAQGNYDQARIWYTHALEIDSNDLPSQGWLGCSLIKLGRIDEGMRWLNRAGTGAWSACRNAALPAVPAGPIRP